MSHQFILMFRSWSFEKSKTTWDAWIRVTHEWWVKMNTNTFHFCAMTQTLASKHELDCKTENLTPPRKEVFFAVQEFWKAPMQSCDQLLLRYQILHTSLFWNCVSVVTLCHTERWIVILIDNVINYYDSNRFRTTSECTRSTTRL